MRRFPKTVFISIMMIVLSIGLISCSSSSTSTEGGSTSSSPGSSSDNSSTNGEPISIKFTHITAPDSPKGKAADHFKKLVKERLDGRVEVKVYPNSSLYADGDGIEALQKGEVQMMAPAPSYFTKWIPEYQVLDLPFVFPTHDAIKEALDGEIGQEMYKLLEPQGLLGLAMWDNGFKQMYAKAPIISVEDFDSVKFRIQPSRILESQFNALGGSAVAMPLGEAYQAIQSGTVDGSENTITNIYSQKHHEVAKHITLSDHGYIGYMVITNKEFWASLPDDIQTELKNILQETTDYERNLAKELDEEYLDKMRNADGVEVHELSNEDRAKWMEATESVYEEYKDIIGESLLRKIQKLRQEHAQ
jgi:C4-dicarboxylate-binding protein DctP